MDLVRSRRMIVLLLSLVLLMAALAGCQIEAADQQDADATATTAADTPTPADSSEDAATTTSDPTVSSGEASEEDESAFPVRVTRTDGEELVIEDRPERIVSLSPGATDTFFAIGAGDQVAAVDMFSDYPPAAAELPKIDAYQPDPEAIAALDPDLVFVVYDAEGLVEILDGLDIPVLFLDAPRSIDGLLEQIELVGRSTGNGDEASALVESLQDRIEAVTERTADVEDSPRVYHELDQQYFTAGPGSFIGDLYTLLGATNIAEGAEGDYPRLSVEVIIEKDPEVIVLPTEGEPGEATPEDVSQRPGWDVIDAVQNDRIYEIDGDIVSRPGPRVVDGLEQLAELLYPEAFVSSHELVISWPDNQHSAAAS